MIELNDTQNFAIDAVTKCFNYSYNEAEKTLLAHKYDSKIENMKQINNEHDKLKNTKQLYDTIINDIKLNGVKYFPYLFVSYSYGNGIYIVNGRTFNNHCGNKLLNFKGESGRIEYTPNKYEHIEYVIPTGIYIHKHYSTDHLCFAAKSYFTITAQDMNNDHISFDYSIDLSYRIRRMNDSGQFSIYGPFFASKFINV